jgi:hypothetical protein
MLPGNQEAITMMVRRSSWHPPTFDPYRGPSTSPTASRASSQDPFRWSGTGDRRLRTSR